ncbi:Bacterial type II secretion system protein F domain protein [Pirellulimonas nuda]|uniref:Bacterial type II secretion system protein F domain protein n=1 Tax=Pirellulimonas nuda TaxID=2528009 RepID=A0A518DF48_9BACT|nr:type II secretion system F family protein [Pirellulimonas nuda]QDU90103.1 Bacterial type II secretion system protein F domain protein [Pirellulimonas nuda]
MLPLALISTSLAAKAGIFCCVAAAVWWVVDLVSSKGSNRVEDRLEGIRDPRGRKNDKRKGMGGQADAMARLIGSASPTLAAPLQPKTEAEAGKLKSKLAHAGFRGENAVSTFLGIKFFCLLAGFVAGGGTMAVIKGLTTEAAMGTVAVAGVMFYLPDVVVWFLRRNRQDAIFMSLPDALDLMVVCVEAGLGLDQAMRKVSEEMGTTYPVLTSEFALSNLHLQMGKSRNDVLHDLGDRTGVDDLKALSAILIQADKFGSSVAQALRVQSDSMRVRRRQMAEEKAAKTAVKLIFPLVLFIFPALFIVLVGPAAITMINEMFPAMQGAG